MKKHFIVILVIAQILLFGCSNSSSHISKEVKENIKSRVKNGTNVGIVAGVITTDEISYYANGYKSLKTKQPVNENTVFEIGSISKTFTGILLADMVVKGELKLNTPIQKLLPKHVKAPTRNGDSIKLYHLSNHTSSFPEMSDNYAPKNPANLYKEYSLEHLYGFLNNYQLKRDIGSKYEYSNYAQGLLGHLLAYKKDMSYEELMLKTIAEPLGLKNTNITLTPKMKENLAIGHNSNGLEVENWDLPTLAGAGAIRSTATDMINFLSVNMGLIKNNLYPAMKLSHAKTTSVNDNLYVGLGWHIFIQDELEILFHIGATGGYRSFAGFIKGGNRGVVVLTNSKSGTSIDDIGFHLLDSRFPLNKPSFIHHLKNSLESDGIEITKKLYWKLKEKDTDLYDFSEQQLNTLGYFYLGNLELEKAIAIFELNIEAFPNSSNVYDSYGEALMKNNEIEKAISSYKKSLKLNPSNNNALSMLKFLGEKVKALQKE